MESNRFEAVRLDDLSLQSFWYYWVFLYPFSFGSVYSFCTAVSYSMFGIAAIFDCFNLYLAMDFDCTPAETMATLLLQSLQRVPDVAESRSRHLIPLFLNFMGYDDGSIFRYLLDDKLSYFYNFDFWKSDPYWYLFWTDFCSADSYMPEKCKGKQWKTILKEWLNLLRLMHNTRSLYQSKFLQEVLTKRSANK